MAVFKEEIYQIKALMKQEVQIYTDSCDTGILATDEMKATVKKLMLSLPFAGTSYKIDTQNHIERTYDFLVQWSDFESTGTKISIHYINDKVRGKEYFHFEVRNV